MKKLHCAGIIGIAAALSLAATGCKKTNSLPETQKQKEQETLIVRSDLPNQIYRTRKNKYSNGDAIGIRALQNGAVYASYKNVKYTTADGSSYKALAGINIPENGSIDLVAYYPYAENADGTVTMNVADQSDLEKIDLLYSNNAKGISRANAEVNLTFEHKFAMLELNLYTNGTAIDKASARATIADVLVEASMNLADGALANGSTKQGVTASFKEITPSVLYTATLILPAQELSAKAIQLKLNGSSYNETLPAALNPKPNDKASITLNFGGSNGHSLSITSSSITPWNTVAAGSISIVPVAGSLSADRASVEFPASGQLTENVMLTAGAAAAWTASSSAAWLKVSPASGTGKATLSLNAEENTSANSRAAIVTITAGAETKEISVTQKAGSTTTTPPPSTSGDPLFPGADFEDWEAFTKCLNKFGLKHAEQSNQGRNGGSALLINGSSTAKNDYVFTLTNKAFSKQLKSITLWINGTIGSGSLSFNVMGQGGMFKPTEYGTFNLGTVDGSSQEITVSEGKQNDYKGSVNTNGQWVKVTIEIPSSLTIEPNQYGDVFAVKIAKNTTANLLIDDITCVAQ